MALRPKPSSRLCHLLRNARGDKVADGCTTKIVNNHSLATHYLLCLRAWSSQRRTDRLARAISRWHHSPRSAFTHALYHDLRKLSILTDLPLRSTRKQTCRHSGWRFANRSCSSMHSAGTIGTARASSFLVSPARELILPAITSAWSHSSERTSPSIIPV
jgi:hypothetical protein